MIQRDRDERRSGFCFLQQSFSAGRACNNIRSFSTVKLLARRACDDICNRCQFLIGRRKNTEASIPNMAPVTISTTEILTLAEIC